VRSGKSDWRGSKQGGRAQRPAGASTSGFGSILAPEPFRCGATNGVSGTS